MGQRKIKEKSPEDLKAERVTAALEETDRTGRTPLFVRENPGQFLRDMYEVWHRQGGKEGGRWRNSIRKMRDEWLTGRNAVPSLHPKLMGRVKLTRSDVRALLDLFLGRWRIAVGDDPISAMTDDGYVGFEATDVRRLRDCLTNLLNSKSEREAFLLPKKEAKPRLHGASLPIHAFIEGEYQHCDALAMLSRNRIAIGPSPPETMKNFLYLFNAFYEEDKKKSGSGCIFIWIVDMGRRLFEDDQSFSEFYNAGFLSLLLQSFAAFDSEQDAATEQRGKLFRQLRIFDPIARQQRWEWLAQRSVVVAENLRWEEFGELYGEEENEIHKVRLRDSGVTAQHILPRETPPNWSFHLRRLAGKKVDVGNVSITAFLNKKGWSISPEKDDYLRYFAHARTIKNTDVGTPNTTFESIELSPPGENYDEAFRIVYFSALHRLSGKSNPDSEEFTAFAYLRKLGFNVLNINDFIRIFRGVH